jgi:sucrose-phosphate synthase
MFVLHIALQGCLRGDGVVYGLTADTGGHIRYLLDLVSASVQDRDLTRIAVATRLFRGPLGDA